MTIIKHLVRSSETKRGKPYFHGLRNSPRWGFVNPILVDKFVFTEKILLYSGNSCLSSPLVLITLGKIYLKQKLLPGQSVGNFCLSTKTSVSTKNTYNSYINLPSISEHVPKHKSNLTDNEFGYFLAGLIEGDGWFGKKELHIIFAEKDKIGRAHV